MNHTMSRNGRVMNFVKLRVVSRFRRRQRPATVPQIQIQAVNPQAQQLLNAGGLVQLTPADSQTSTSTAPDTPMQVIAGPIDYLQSSSAGYGLLLPQQPVPQLRNEPRVVTVNMYTAPNHSVYTLDMDAAQSGVLPRSAVAPQSPQANIADGEAHPGQSRWLPSTAEEPARSDSPVPLHVTEGTQLSAPGASSPTVPHPSEIGELFTPVIPVTPAGRPALIAVLSSPPTGERTSNRQSIDSRSSYGDSGRPLSLPPSLHTTQPPIHLIPPTPGSTHSRSSGSFYAANHLSVNFPTSNNDPGTSRLGASDSGPDPEGVVMSAPQTPQDPTGPQFSSRPTSPRRVRWSQTERDSAIPEGAFMNWRPGQEPEFGRSPLHRSIRSNTPSQTFHHRYTNTASSSRRGSFSSVPSRRYSEEPRRSTSQDRYWDDQSQYYASQTPTPWAQSFDIGEPGPSSGRHQAPSLLEGFERSHPFPPVPMDNDVLCPNCGIVFNSREHPVRYWGYPPQSVPMIPVAPSGSFWVPGGGPYRFHNRPLAPSRRPSSLASSIRSWGRRFSERRL